MLSLNYLVRVNNVFLIFITFFLMGILAQPLSATAYSKYYEPSDNDWASGFSTDSGGTGYAEYYVDGYSGKLEVFTSTAILGWAESKVWVYKDFSYDHHSWDNTISLHYRRSGSMARVPNGESHFLVYLELWDITSGTPGTRIATRKSVNKKSETEDVPNQPGNITFTQYLEENHTYRLKFIVYASCEETSGIGSASIDFMHDLPPLPDRHVQVSYLKIKHAHSAATTYGENQAGSHARGQFYPLQKDFDFAKEIKFWVGTEDDYADELEGWWFQIFDFNNAASSRYSDTTAYGRGYSPANTAGIPYDYDVHLNISLHLDRCSESSSACQLQGLQWVDAAGRSTAKAMPDHGWIMLYPSPVPGQPGYYSHKFIMKNPNPLETLSVDALTFLATEDVHQDLSKIEYPGDTIYDFSVTNPTPWSIDIVTEGDLLGGYIYFAYNLIDSMGEHAIPAWGCYQVTEPPLISDTDEISAATGGQANLHLNAGTNNAGRLYLILGSLTGSVPGISLPNGGDTLPINWDSFTQFVLAKLNFPIFHNFLGVLSAEGVGQAQLNLGILHPKHIGKVMHFAYCLEGAPDWDFASNPVAIGIIN